MSQAVRNEVLRPLILVVDDEPSITSTLSQVLEDESFETMVAHSGEEACTLVETCRPDVIFLDIWMPGRDGIETLARLKELVPDTQVIMISGHATIANALEAQRRGAFDFIEKPLDIDAIVHTARRAYERRLSETQKGQATEAEVKREPVLTHPGVTGCGLKGKNLGQRTLKDSIILYGQGLHSGQKSGLVLEPLPVNSGIHFSQMGHPRSLPAFVDFVQSTDFATRIQSAEIGFATIEHLLSALHAYGVSNLLVKCNQEVPIFDGSALEFCRVIEEVGLEEQGGEWFELSVDEPIVISSGTESITFEPGEGFSIDYELNYPEPVGHQQYSFHLKGCESYKAEIAPARTFGFMKDIERLQKAGLAAGGRLDNFILIGNDGVVNTELRFANELARHKILDIIGDLFLLGRPLAGKITARMTGHSDNVELISELRKRACP